MTTTLKKYTGPRFDEVTALLFVFIPPFLAAFPLPYLYLCVFRSILLINSSCFYKYFTSLSRSSSKGNIFFSVKFGDLAFLLPFTSPYFSAMSVSVDKVNILFLLHSALTHTNQELIGHAVLGAHVIFK